MIQAYKILTLFECKITKSCIASVTFSFETGKEKALMYPFADLSFAKTYLDKEARDWFLACLEKFIHHKKKLIADERHEQWKSLEVCEKALMHYETQTTLHVCEKFIKGYNYFIGILPHPHNDSYQSSEHNLKELRTFCEEFVKFKNLFI